MALRCLLGCRNQCNAKKLGFLGSHLTRHHHHHPIPSSWSFFTTTTTTTNTTTLPAEGSPDEHHRRGGTRTSIINERQAVDSTTTTLPEGHCVETVTLGGGLGNLGGTTEKREAEINPRVNFLAQFASLTIGMDLRQRENAFVRVISAMVQLVNKRRVYYITMEVMDGKLYGAHVLDSLIESNSICVIDWCELKSPSPPPPPPLPPHSFDYSQDGPPD